MSNFSAPGMAMAALALALAILYAAWHEYKARNGRDAKLLTAAGAVSLIGSAVAWLQ